MRRFNYLLVLCLFLVACASVPKRSQDPNRPETTLPERSFIEGIKIEYGQAFSDCLPVALEALFKFYGVHVDRKEISDKIQKFSGTHMTDAIVFVKLTGFNIYYFPDESPDKRWIKYYLSRQMPVLVLIGNVWSGHAAVVVGYDDARQVFLVADPERRKIMEWQYVEFDEWHRPLGNQAFLVYPPSVELPGITEYSKAVETESTYAQAYAVAYGLQGFAYFRANQYDDAISLYTKALDIDPKCALAHNNLAWLYATARDSRFWHGKEALEHARTACELTDWKKPECLETLAAAYARVGDFGNAIKWQEKALGLEEKTKTADAQQRLDLYRMGKPWPAS